MVSELAFPEEQEWGSRTPANVTSLYSVVFLIHQFMANNFLIMAV